MRRALILVSGGGSPRLSEPKTPKSRRTIYLRDGAVAALREHRQRTLPASGLVFTSTTGAPIGRDSLNRRCWKPLLRQAGLPSNILFHDLRHTCAPLLLSRNVHTKYVLELLGHPSISVTLDTYSHVIPSMDGSTAGAMDDALGE